MRTLLSALCVAILNVALLPSAAACSCYDRSLEEHYDYAALVFVARVVGMQDTFIEVHGSRLPWGYAGRFELLKAMKGDAASVSRVETGRGSADCGVGLAVGETYVFFADTKGRVDSCTGTQVYVPGHEPHERIVRRLGQLRSRAR